MAKKVSFPALTPQQKEQAKGRFFNANDRDGYLYEVDLGGNVLCRRRQVRASKAVH